MGGSSADLGKALLLFILLVSAPLCSTSTAGVPRKLMDEAAGVGAVAKEIPERSSHDGEEPGVHHRILKVKMNDYGSYDPSPAFVKPPFKAILN